MSVNVDGYVDEGSVKEEGEEEQHGGEGEIVCVCVCVGRVTIGSWRW